MAPLTLSCTCREHEQTLTKEYSARGLKCMNLPASKDLGLSEILATKLALDALEGYKARPLPTPACDKHKEDLINFPFRVFGTLDHDLFRSVLSGEVYMTWADLPRDIHGVTSKPGVCDSRITIELNNDLKKSRPKFTLAVLIHHMAHAYYLTCCGYRDKADETSRHDLGHRLGFNTLVYKITEVIKPDGKAKLSDLTRFEAPRSSPERRVSQQKSGSSTCSLLEKLQVTMEACQDHLLTLRGIQISELTNNKKANPFPKSHYLHIIKESTFTPVPRTQYSLDTTKEIQLDYSSYTIPFPRVKLLAFSSLLPRLAIPATKLSIPAPSDEIFFYFHDFVLDGDYKPKLERHASPYMDITTSNGPPIIHPFHPDGKPYLLTDVGVFVLGCKMGFTELKDKARKRMYAMKYTRESPIAALDAIYSADGINGEDKDLLREWARHFLRKRSRETKKMNAFILSERDGQWTSDFNELREKHHALDADFNLILDIEILSRALETIKLGNKSDKKKDDEELLQTQELLEAVLAEAVTNPSTLLSIKGVRNSRRGVVIPSWFNLASRSELAGRSAPAPDPLTPQVGDDIALTTAEDNYLHYYFPDVARCWRKVVDERKKVTEETEKKGREKKEKKEKEKKTKQEKDEREKVVKEREERRKKNREEKEKKAKEEKEKKAKEQAAAATAERQRKAREEEQKAKDREERERPRRVREEQERVQEQARLRRCIHKCISCYDRGVPSCPHDGELCVFCNARRVTGCRRRALPLPPVETRQRRVDGDRWYNFVDM